MAAREPAIGELCVIGHPSRYGGADTELDHQITCWRAMGVNVHICHTGPLHDGLRSLNLEGRGCIYHAPCDWQSVAGMHCISFCNGNFLNSLPEIKRYARTTTFVNCMTWNFDKEVEMQARGLIDFHLYQTRHAYDNIRHRLEATGNYRPLFVQPYFDRTQFPFIENRPADRFRFGRISRADLDKFNHRQLWIYETMTAPVPKEGIIVGWDARIEAKFGRPPASYIRTYPPSGLSQLEFYRSCSLNASSYQRVTILLFLPS